MSEPKFKPGDIVQVRDNEREADRLKSLLPDSIEHVVVAVDIFDRLIFDIPKEVSFRKNAFDLVFRPATRAETEALRKIAATAEDLIALSAEAEENSLTRTFAWKGLKQMVTAWKEYMGE